MDINAILPHIYFVYMFAGCGYAVYRGGRFEYIGAAVMVGGSVATFIGLAVLDTPWTGFYTSTFAIDMLVLLALIHLAIVSDRFWPLWMAGFHLVAVLVHAATMLVPDTATWALATGAAFWAYPMILALAIGAHEHVRCPEDEGQRSPG